MRYPQKKSAPSRGLGRILHLPIVAFRGERGSYNRNDRGEDRQQIVAFRGERGSYNKRGKREKPEEDCSFPG